MELLIASIFSGKVILWQIFLGFVQVIGRSIAGKKGLMVTFALVIFWTLLKTFNGLLLLQIFVQSIIFFILYNDNSTEK